MGHIISFTGNSNSGKTTIIEKLISSLTEEGYKIGTVKHAHKGFELDKSGKDSFRHMEAGAEMVIIADPEKIHITKKIKIDTFANLKPYFAEMDLIIVEGYKKESIPQIPIIQDRSADRFLYVNNPFVIAFISDINTDCRLPVFKRNDTESLSRFIKGTFL